MAAKKPETKPEEPKTKFTEEDFNNLDGVFKLAKQTVIHDDTMLINLIQFKGALFEKMKE